MTVLKSFTPFRVFRSHNFCIVFVAQAVGHLNHNPIYLIPSKFISEFKLCQVVNLAKAERSSFPKNIQPVSPFLKSNLLRTLNKILS